MDANQLVKKKRGRAFNALTDTYDMTADVNEWDRLDTQHRAITLGGEGLYPVPEVVHAVLAPQDGVKKKIVDLGYGSGIWATEMAKEFPRCEVLGLDVAPVPLPPNKVPANCRFEMQDINHGLTNNLEMYDVVFASAVGMGLKDFRKSLADMMARAKPGGIVILTDGDYNFYSFYEEYDTPEQALAVAASRNEGKVFKPPPASTE